MGPGVIGLCGQCVTNLVTVEKDQELDCVTIPHQSLAEKNAMENHCRKVYVTKKTAQVNYHCSNTADSQNQ